MRIIIIDLLFSWPPHGGADVDVYHVARGLIAQGHDVRLLFIRETSVWERGQADITTLPFPAECLSFEPASFTESEVCRRIVEAVNRTDPAFIFLAQGYFLKVPLILALKQYPIISRCYAHETACHKDILRFKHGAPCPNEYKRTPDTCRACALESHRNAIITNTYNAWTQEYRATSAWSPSFYMRFRNAMHSLHGVIVTNQQMRTQVTGLCERIHVIPPGVDVERFALAAEKKRNDCPVLLAPGRMEDPAKGMGMLLDAAARLAEAGRRFELHVTLPEGHGGPSWLKPIGKVDHEEMPKTYQGADICVVPSVWEEPFGIVALEAMASGVPVCASRTGGLQDIVVHEKTGTLFTPGDANALAATLDKMLDNRDELKTMGMAGRTRVLEHYTWDNVLECHYKNLFQY